MQQVVPRFKAQEGLLHTIVTTKPAIENKRMECIGRLRLRLSLKYIFQPFGNFRLEI